MFRKASIAMAASGLCGDGLPGSRLRRRHRRLPDPEPDPENHLHGRPVHGRGPRHRPDLLRALHDRLHNRPVDVQHGARDRIYWFFSMDYAGRRQYSEDTATNVYYEQMATRWATGPSCSSTTRASPRTAPTSVHELPGRRTRRYLGLARRSADGLITVERRTADSAPDHDRILRRRCGVARRCGRSGRGLGRLRDGRCRGCRSGQRT